MLGYFEVWSTERLPGCPDGECWGESVGGGGGGAPAQATPLDPSVLRTDRGRQARPWGLCLAPWDGSGLAVVRGVLTPPPACPAFGKWLRSLAQVLTEDDRAPTSVGHDLRGQRSRP